MSQHVEPMTPALRAGILARAGEIGITFVLQAAVLFLTAGTLAWGWAWLYLGIYLVTVGINATVLLRTSPATIAERGHAGPGVKRWDAVLSGAWALTYFLLLLIVAGLDRRLGWTGDLRASVQVLGAVVFAAGLALFSWAMVVNAYFSTLVRIQQERGHAVCTDGPYAVIRHPGYLGAIAQSLGVPLLLGSLPALAPGVLAAALMIARTVLEDRTLQAELPGYAAYARQVRSRLLPGIW